MYSVFKRSLCTMNQTRLLGTNSLCTLSYKILYINKFTYLRLHGLLLTGDPPHIFFHCGIEFQIVPLFFCHCCAVSRLVVATPLADRREAMAVEESYTGLSDPHTLGDVMWWLIGSSPDCWGSCPGIESGISHSGKLCVYMYCKI